MKKPHIYFGKIAILVGCCALTSCASQTPRASTSSNPIPRPPNRDLTSERYYNAETGDWEFEQAG
jgi:hypothetical protein